MIAPTLISNRLICIRNVDCSMKPKLLDLFIRAVSTAKLSRNVLDTPKGTYIGSEKGLAGASVNWEDFVNKRVKVRILENKDVQFIETLEDTNRPSQNKIFTREDWNKNPSKTRFLFNYTSKDNWERVSDKLVQQSRDCLIFKDKIDRKFNETIMGKVDIEIQKNVTLCCVPPSKTDNDQHCILQLLRFLSDRGRTNASSCLKRIKDIVPLHRGGNRMPQTHYDSIATFNKELINNKTVLLLDDVTTSGMSLEACERILKKKCGAKVVFKFAIWRTLGNWELG